MERGCRSFGACGKSEETANLQDLLIHKKYDIYQIKSVAEDLAAING
jgi:hypothetical protein